MPPFLDAVAVVTGAGSGIGRALAEELSERGVRHCVLVDRDSERVETAAIALGHSVPGMVSALVLDVADAAAVAKAVDDIERTVGPIGLWFSNAGINPATGLGDPIAWRAALDVNLLAHVHVARALLPLMEERGSGYLVITASAAGLTTDLRNAPYPVTKHAAVALAEWLGATAAAGVRIACICPEGVLTAMTTSNSREAVGHRGFMAAREAARRSLDAIARGDFLITTHEGTVELERRRVLDRARWLAGLRAARSRADAHFGRRPVVEG